MQRRRKTVRTRHGRGLFTRSRSSSAAASIRGRARVRGQLKRGLGRGYSRRKFTSSRRRRGA
jgi:hypothetical protein